MQSQHFIDGQWTSADRWTDSLDPANGELIGCFADGGEAEAEAAVAAAARAFNNPQWAQNPRLRQQLLLEWAAALKARQEQLAQLLTRENGKALAQSRGEIGGAISEILYYAGLARHNPGHMLEVAPGEFSSMLREPAGVAGLIIPWNAPAVLLVRALAPAIAAGCTVVIKPAPQTALFNAAMLEPLFALPGLPAGAVNLFAESGHAGAAHLVASPRVDVLSFTGSTATGQRIMRDCAATMKKLSLELGGKSCCLVFEDADIAAIAPKLAAAATIISGQQCTAARRVLVHASRFAEMKTALSAALGQIRLGNGLDPAKNMGPLIDWQSRDSVERRIGEALDSCDEVLLTGGRPHGELSKGAFLAPSLIAHRDSSAFFCQEEIFGPLLVLESFEDETEAVARANHTEFGLSASVWTEQGARAWRVARALRNGTVWLNDHNKLFAEAETGGYRKSGLGRLHGVDALLDFSELKHIYQNVGTLG
ncbi:MULTISPECIES: aldehyde dehydrogenase family protein [Pseudomonas]|jgi:betaine-aldehyde dehydrogenase|uniref:Aldehyde dehydrogenase n=1 Tax=Pseudomonas umsongensis TaxID=198618 RepID=A0ABX4DMI8_9PSED|nr:MULTISPECIES: aldehyde dehydrogenase family protein [Pseudomonas]EPA93878.1 aldehyde dehydrogenase [Pseudomonas sp. G5(2012)]KEX94571.1 aldehyde dehydrogenase [Pseudomonas putida]OXR27772.1 aldehyde dehydrogenase [Pseudomonas umsongensis]SDS69268.1 Acyl-CoA reductase [Pseudomonas umsongensis]